MLFGLTFWGLNLWLDSYTRHGENISVPDLSRLSYQEAEDKLNALGLKAEILDTAEYNPEMPRGAVVDQFPASDALVKVNREIKLTLNPLKPRKIAIPDLVEKTKRRALYDLESKGFKVGELEYVPFIGKDVVVDVKVDGLSVSTKDKFEKGTKVVLVLGQGLGNERKPMPYLKWKALDEAQQKLFDHGLNLGSVQFDPEVTDTALALVYKQYPPADLEPSVKAGISVDVWLTQDYTKISNDSLAFQNSAISSDTTLNANDSSSTP